MKRSWVVALALVAFAFVLVASGCTDKAKVSEKAAHANLDALITITNADVAQIETGLPQGAQKLASLWANGADPRQDLRAVRSALVKMRRDVPDLTVAKSTFFALTDDHGVAIRNDLEEDVMAGQDLLKIFPDLAKALAGSYVTTTGVFPPTTPQPAPDTNQDWIAAAPIKKADGTVGGLLVTGWTLRRYAYHLEEQLRHDLEAAQQNARLPILYVFVFDASGVYGASRTPKVNEKAIGDVGPVNATAGGVAEGTLSITDRDFGWVAGRVPKLGATAGIAVLRSEL
jgi:hypothetical protein